MAISIVAALGGAIGLARWTPDGALAPGLAEPSATPAASAIAAASAGPSTAPRGSIGARIERLLDVPDAALDGGPTLVLVEQAELDLGLLRWTPGAGLTRIRTFRGALSEANEAVVPILAPTGDRLVLLVPGNLVPGNDAPADAARIVDDSGAAIWSGDDIATESGAVWSADGAVVAIAGHARRWHLIALDGAGRAKDRVVELPGEIFLPSPIPIGSISIPRLAPRTVPLGFSADGAWIYGGVISPELGFLIGEFRVATDGRRVERVGDLAVGTADGLLPRPGTLGGRLVDPAAGRIANWRVNQNTTGGPPMLEIRNRDAGFAFTVDAAIPLGSGWDADGSLYLLAADSVLYANQTTFARVNADGSVGNPILETGPLTSASLLGVRDGYAALALWATKPDVAAQLILLDLADPARITALDLPMGGATTIIAADLRP